MKKQKEKQTERLVGTKRERKLGTTRQSDKEAKRHRDQEGFKGGKTKMADKRNE